MNQGIWQKIFDIVFFKGCFKRYFGKKMKTPMMKRMI